MKKILYILIILAVSFHTASAQEKGEVNPSIDKKFNNLSYKETIRVLSKKAESGDASPELLAKLANAYYSNVEMKDAAKYFGQLIGSQSSTIDSENIYRYAMALKATGKYDEANKYMKQFSSLKPQDSRARLLSKSPDYLETIDKLSGGFTLENLDFNSAVSDFGASFYKNGIVFASTRNEGKLYKWNEQPFLQLFYKEEASDNAKLFSSKVNTKFHESSTSFTKDGNTMYFTRNYYHKGKVSKTSDKVIGLKVYKATLKEGQWTDIISMPFNSDEYNVAHPALSKDEKQLFFASDMPGTNGQSDIYMVDILGNGTYGSPINLGKMINTAGRENFPFVSNNGSLYFSSDGHPGLGGLDIFMADLDNLGKNPVNLAKPVNSERDDFEFIIDEFSNLGYLTSNRYHGKGDDDIYKFTRAEPCTQKVIGTVKDKNTGEIITEAKVIIYDSNNKEVYNFMSDAKGQFKYDSDCKQGTYKAVGSKDGYEPSDITYTIDPEVKLDLDLKLDLTPKAPVKAAAAVGTDLFKLLNLNPIYFDYDKAFIRGDAQAELSKVIAYLKEYPSVHIDVQSHTDSRGRDAYNMDLSTRRNVSTRDWIINRGGIDRSRISGKGYGESQLVNRCSNGVKCSKQEHQENRRSMFIITKN